MRLRFTLSHPESGLSEEISEPDGWKDAVLKLDRHEEFHSLIEYFDGSFIFYGNNGIVNGGIQIIKSIIQEYGIDTTLNISIDFTHDEISFSEIFDGQLSLVDSEEMPDNKIRVPIIPDDRWTKFIARIDTPVSLQSSLNLDNELVDASERIDLKLSPQKIETKYLANFLVGVFYDDPGNDFLNEYIQITPPDITLDEIEEAFVIPNATNPVLPSWNFEMLYAGDYEFNLRIEASDHTIIGAGGLTLDGKAKIFFQINNQTPIEFTLANHTSTEDSTSFTYQATHALLVGDIVRIYGFVNSVLSGRFYIWGVDNPEVGNGPPSGFTNPTFWDIIGKTTFPENRSQGYLIHDGADAIIKRITNVDLYSEYLGSRWTKARQYISDGCAWAYSQVKGLQLRQYTFDEKAFFMSFMQWWRGVNPILNLSLSYETVQVPEVIDVSPDINLIEDLDDWSNEPGAGWDFITYGHPFVSVNGGGGVEGYACGEGVFNEDQLYPFDTEILIQTTGAETPNIIVTWAILDASFNELDTQVFNYVGPGLKSESFLMTPSGIGAYLAVKIQNDTPTETKNIEVTLAFSEFPQIIYHEERVIRIEKKSEQYDDSNGTSVDFYNVRDITKKFDNDRIFNKVSIGYARWESEDVSGIDDPQTKKTYATRFKKVGKGIDLYSEWIGASLVIEKCRRTTREKSADYKYDNETFIIALNPIPQDESPDTSPDILTFIPELDENFSSVENLLNSETRYNLKITPSRNFLRWQDFLQGALQSYPDSDFKFSSAEGNYDMTSVMDEGCSDEDFNRFELDEKGDIQVTDNFLHLPDLYELTIPMEWSEYEQIRNNKKKPIGVSVTDSGLVPVFIKTLSYRPMHGTATILGWAKEFLDLNVISDTTPMQECLPSVPPGLDCENGITDEDGLFLTDEFGECITADEPGETGLALDFALDGAL